MNKLKFLVSDNFLGETYYSDPEDDTPNTSFNRFNDKKEIF